MHGIVLTQAKKPLHYQPSAAAIILEKTNSISSKEAARTAVRVLRPSDFEYARIFRSLAEAELRIVNFALAPPPSDRLNPTQPR
jgi:hypothetical protein